MNKSKIKHIFYFSFGLALILGLAIIFGLIYPIFLVYSYSFNFALIIFLIILGISIFLIYYGIGGLKWNIRKDSNKESLRLPENFYLNIGIYALFFALFITWFNLLFFLFDFSAVHDDVGYVLTHMLVVFIIGGNILFFLTSFLALRYHKKLKISPSSNSDKSNRKRTNLEIFKIRRIQSICVIGVFISMGITGALTYFIFPECYWGEMGFSDPAYELPSGAHYNTALDSLAGDNKTILEALERGLWAITKLRQQGGFPMWVETDGSHFYSDRGFGCPLFPGEFSIQEGTPLLGTLYLEMYKFENNSIYLDVAKDTADALLAVQDEIYGGFYYDGRRHEDGTGYQPHPKNWMRSTILDDDVTQSALEFLLDMYNLTKEQKYLDAFEKGFEELCDIEKPQGGWPHRSNFQNFMYFSYITLNDNLMKDVVFLLYKANQIFPGESKYLDTAKRACDFLKNVQGNGGSAFQKGWAQQYYDNNQPAWARTFEPPAICSFQTVSAMEMLLEMFLITNDTSWLEPLPAAINWLNSSDTRISWQDGGTTKTGWARLYELETNKPIYGIENGKGTLQPYVYNYEDARGGYSWLGDFGVETFFNRYNLLVSLNYNITEFREAKASAVTLTSAFNSAWAAKESQTSDGFWLNEEKIRAGSCASAIMAMITYLKRL